MFGSQRESSTAQLPIRLGVVRESYEWQTSEKLRLPKTLERTETVVREDSEAGFFIELQSIWTLDATRTYRKSQRRCSRCSRLPRWGQARRSARGGRGHRQLGWTSAHGAARCSDRAGACSTAIVAIVAVRPIFLRFEPRGEKAEPSDWGGRFKFAGDMARDGKDLAAGLKAITEPL